MVSRVFLIGFVWSVLVFGGEARSWKSTDGRALGAAYVSRDGNDVVLRPYSTGKEVTVAKGLSALPPEMVEYLKEIRLHYNGIGFWWGGGSTIYYAMPKDLKFNGPLEKCIAFPSAYGLTTPGEDFAEFAAIVKRAWTTPQEMIEIEEVFPWRHKIYTDALGYRRAKSRGAEAVE